MLVGLPDECSVSIFSFFDRSELCRLQLKKRIFNAFIEQYFAKTPPFAILRTFNMDSRKKIFVDNRQHLDGTQQGLDEILSIEEAIGQLSMAKYLRADNPEISFIFDDDNSWEEGVDIGFGPYNHDEIESLKHIWQNRPLSLYFFGWQPTLEQIYSGCFNNSSKLACAIHMPTRNFPLINLECSRLKILATIEEISINTIFDWMQSVPLSNNFSSKIDIKYLIIESHIYHCDLQSVVVKLKEDFHDAKKPAPYPYVIQFDELKKGVYRGKAAQLASSNRYQKNAKTGEILICLRFEYKRSGTRMLILARLRDDQESAKFDQWLIENGYPKRLFQELIKEDILDAFSV